MKLSLSVQGLFEENIYDFQELGKLIIEENSIYYEYSYSFIYFDLKYNENLVKKCETNLYTSFTSISEESHKLVEGENKIKKTKNNFKKDDEFINTHPSDGSDRARTRSRDPNMFDELSNITIFIELDNNYSFKDIVFCVDMIKKLKNFLKNINTISKVKLNIKNTIY